DRASLPDQSHHSLAAIAHDRIGKHRLVLDVWVDAKAVERHVGGRQYAGKPPRCSQYLREVSKSNLGMKMGAAHHSQPQGVGRYRLGTVDLATRQLRHAIHLGQTRADCRSIAQGGGLTVRAGSQHRLDNLAVTGAAADHAAQSRLDVATSWNRHT